VPLSVKDRRVMRLIAALQIAFGGMLVLKAVLTVTSGTAWDDLGSASRETQPLEFWLFVLVYFVPGAAIAWMGVNTWRTR
jgi:hypothetical protein